MNEKITTADELLSAYRDDTLKNRHVDIPSADLRGAALYRADLSGANLRGADLSRANLSRANLSGANLSRADLSRANLSGANLSGANLSGADLSEADLSRANLSGANLSGAALYRADLSEANLYRANLSGANLSRADLSRANLSGANLYRANLSGANLSRANLSGANLLSSIGIYNVFGLGMSSRKDKLCGGLMLEDGEIQLFLQAGCQRCSPAELREKVKTTHGENSYAQQYEIAITCIEKLFAVDMASGKWDYLKTWEVDHSKAKENKS